MTVSVRGPCVRVKGHGKGEQALREWHSKREGGRQADKHPWGQGKD